MSDVAMRVENLRKEYRVGLMRPQRVLALDGVTLTLRQGEVLGLLGPNGAGKTTLVKIACGLVRATEGDVLVQGHSVTIQRSQCIRFLGAVLEGNRNIYWNLSPVENLRYFGVLRGVPMRTVQSRVRELLTNFDLWEKRDMPVGSLSRGMQQKLAVCCALIADPPVLLLDEPTLGLDVVAATHITEVLRSLVKEDKKAVLLTTHDMQLAAGLSDRIAVINRGKLVKVGAPREYLDLLRRTPWRIVCEGRPTAFLDVDLRRCAGGHSIDVEDGAAFSIVIEIREGDDESVVLYQVMDLLRKHGVKVLSVDRPKRELKEAFLSLTGKEAPDGAVDPFRS